MLLWKLNYSPNPPSDLNTEVCFPSSMTLVQKHVVASVLKFRAEIFLPSSHRFCWFKKKKKAKGEIFREIFLQADVCLCIITLRISMALVKNWILTVQCVTVKDGRQPARTFIACHFWRQALFTGVHQLTVLRALHQTAVLILKIGKYLQVV